MTPGHASRIIPDNPAAFNAWQAQWTERYAHRWVAYVEPGKASTPAQAWQHRTLRLLPVHDVKPLRVTRPFKVW